MPYDGLGASRYVILWQRSVTYKNKRGCNRERRRTAMLKVRRGFNTLRDRHRWHCAGNRYYGTLGTPESDPLHGRLYGGGRAYHQLNGLYPSLWGIFLSSRLFRLFHRPAPRIEHRKLGRQGWPDLICIDHSFVSLCARNTSIQRNRNFAPWCSVSNWLWRGRNSASGI